MFLITKHGSCDGNFCHRQRNGRAVFSTTLILVGHHQVYFLVGTKIQKFDEFHTFDIELYSLAHNERRKKLAF